MKIGVFDSGVGGENVTRAIQRAIPEARVLFKDDHKNLPYGNKAPEQIMSCMMPILNEFKQEDIDVLVIACNTASTNVLQQIKEYMNVPVVGFVPMVKPASALTKTGFIMVCATPGTLKSEKYKELKELYAQDITVLEPDCSEWASYIQSNTMDQQKVAAVMNMAQENNADVLVLGCTHYHWIEDMLDQLSGPGIDVIQPTDAVIAELRKVTADLRQQ